MFRGLNSALALLFLFGAAVQYNDPDPVPWMAIYLAASIACVLAATKKLRWWFAAAVGLVAVVWASILAPRIFPGVRIAELFGAWEMANNRVEEGREMYGLIVIAASMSILAIVTWRMRKRAVGIPANQ
jgi:hypothetical protein